MSHQHDPEAQLRLDVSATRGCTAFFLCVLLTATTAQGANVLPKTEETPDLTELSLEQLMNTPVTSVARQAQPLAQSPAAIFVITQEDFRRSGATTIPEALRMVPGLQVARLDANKWAISARGFNGRFANKLLVLMDGRTVYTPLFSGVYWDVQDTMIEDIDRIEVIRGPGATLWGANAVNGVINIITKRAKDTQGGLAVAGAGTFEQGFTGLRYGTKLGENTHIRGYGRFFARADQVTPSGDPATDHWHNARGGFRMDHTASSKDTMTLQGDYYNGVYHDRVVSPTLTTPFSQTTDEQTQITGGNLIARWTRSLSADSGFTVQGYYDRSERYSPRLGEARDIADLDFQHHFGLGTANRIIWGLGYRFTNDHLTNSSTISFRPTSRVINIVSGFVQDEIAMVPEKLSATIGTKVEHNDFTGVVVQPNGRLRWTPNERQTLWASVSRAIRIPSRAEDDARINQTTAPPSAASFGLPALAAAFGDRGYGNEKLLAYELGYRHQLTDKLSVDIASFYNNYKDLRTLERGTAGIETSPTPVHVLVPFTASNKLRAETYGVEVSTEWRPIDWWRLQASYTYLEMRLYTDQSTDPTAGAATGENPTHQASLRSLMNPVKSVDVDLWGRYVDRLSGLAIPSYLTLDARLGWRPTSDLEVSLVGQNLLDTHHPEFSQSIVSTTPTEVQRSVYGKVTMKF